MGETLIFKKYQQLPVTDQILVAEFIEFLFDKQQKISEGQKRKKRVLGTLKGQIEMSKDFNEPLDDLKEYTRF